MVHEHENIVNSDRVDDLVAPERADDREERVSYNAEMDEGKKRPLVAVDIDEVLAMFLGACNGWYNKKYGTKYEPIDYCSYNFCETWGCTDEQALKDVYEFFDSPDFDAIRPVPGSQEGLTRLAENFDLAIVTSRQLFLKDRTHQWLQKMYPNIKFSHILFSNKWLAAGADTSKRYTKRQLCESISADYLIDDLPNYIIETSPILKMGILFDRDGNQKWSKLPEDSASLLDKNVVVCQSWDEICAVLEMSSTKMGVGGTIDTIKTLRKIAVNSLNPDGTTSTPGEKVEKILTSSEETSPVAGAVLTKLPK